MNHRWGRIMATLGLLGCLAVASSACMVRAQGHLRVRPAAAVYVVDEAPPPPQYREVVARPGYIWVRGHWEWRGGQWVWADGHWERERRGYVFQEGHWEQRGNRWHWIEGSWVVGSDPSDRHHHEPPRHVHVDYPTAAPPAPREVERPAARSGYVWVQGRWQWRNGNWDWVAGHWERERRGYEWQAGRWERQGDRYVWIDGGWIEVRTGPVVHDRRGGGGVEPPRHHHGGARGPTVPPPALRVESPAPRSGYVWVQGRWQWQNDNWEWVAGHWERARRGFVWQPGSWQLQGGVYVWMEGQWVQDTGGGPRVHDRRTQPGDNRPNEVVPSRRND